MTDKIVYEGGCLCGAIRYRAETRPLWEGHCHCTMCRKQAGAPYVTWVTVPTADLVFVKGTPKVYKSSDKAHRQFCGDCGTPLTFQYDEKPKRIDLAAATLDRPELVTPRQNVYFDTRIEAYLHPELLPARTLP